MREERLSSMMKGDDILIHLKNGSFVCGSYLGNYDRMKRVFEFKNHRSYNIEKVRIDDVESLVY